MGATKEPAEKKTIFGILEDHQSITAALEALEASSGDEEALAILRSAADELDSKEREKIDDYGAVITALETRAKIAKAEADSYDDEIKRLKGIAKGLETQAKRLKEVLKAVMNAKGVDVLEGVMRKFRVQRNAQPALIVDEYKTPEELLENVPKEYIKMVPQIDIDAVKKALAEEGAELDFARYSYGDYIRMY